MVKLPRQAKIKILYGLFLLLTVGSVDARSPVPVIFIHGLAGSADTWKSFGDFLQQNGWSFGGCPISLAPGSAGNFCPPTASLSPGDFYRVQFSDNQNLTFDQQGGELKDIVNAVLALNPGKSRVFLVGHSMGGLAARDYLQIHSSGENVLRLVTIGTPHLGSEIAAAAQEACRTDINSVLCDLLQNKIQIDPFSVAVTQLNPISSDMQTLNNLHLYPLPNQILYTSIVGTGKRDLVLRENGDGIVTARSQNLRNVVGTHNISHKRITVLIRATDKCFARFETHRCESSDIGVWATLLDRLRPLGGGLTQLEQTQLDILNRAARDSRFRSVIIGSFGRNPDWHPEWELSWLDFNFLTRDQEFKVVRVIHRTNKSNPSRRYTNFQDPVTLKWAGWRRAS